MSRRRILKPQFDCQPSLVQSTLKSFLVLWTWTLPGDVRNHLPSLFVSVRTFCLSQLFVIGRGWILAAGIWLDSAGEDVAPKIF
jgi:hypothetical protein